MYYEQFNDVITGTGAQRWASNVAFTSQMKVAGMMGTMNQLIAPQLKAVDQRLDQLILNRVPGKPGLKDKHDWVDGGIVNEMGNPLHRLYNAFSPFPYHETPSVTKQYMTDVEYDSVPNRSTRSDGVEYTTDTAYGLLTTTAELIYRGDFQQRVFNSPIVDQVDSYTITNFTASLDLPGDQWGIDLMLLNAGDKDGMNSSMTDVFGVAGTGIEYIPPRQIMGRVSYQF